MSLRYLVDTNILSEPLRRDPDPGILRGLEKHELAIAVPSPVWHELLFGVHRLPRSRRRERIQQYLDDVVRSSFPILPYDQEAAAWHAERRAALAKRGETSPFVDGQIAAVAAVHDLALVTLNQQDFRFFSEVEIVDWRSAR